MDTHIDFSCPFSYIGGEKILQSLEKEDLLLSTIKFKSFQLNPAKNNTQTNFLKNMSQQFGTDIQGTIARYESIIKTGKELGLKFDVTKVIDVNSLNAHIGLQFATKYDQQTNYFRKIMSGHWENGKDFSDMLFIKNSLKELNLDIEEFEKSLDDLKKQVNEDIKLGNSRRIQGVPTFYRDRILPLQSNSTFDEFKRVLND